MTKYTVDRLWKQITSSTPEAKMTLNVDWSRLFSSALWITSLGFIEGKFPSRFFLRDKTCFINMEHLYSYSRQPSPRPHWVYLMWRLDVNMTFLYDFAE